MYSTEEILRTIQTIEEKERVLQDPLTLAHSYFGITPNELQSTFLTDLQNDALLGFLLQAPRGGGKTLVAAISILWAALSNKYDSFKALILSGSFEQAKTFYSYIRLFLKQCPPLQAMLECPPTQSETRFTNNGFIKVLTASEKSTRSPHVDMLVIDEFVLVTGDLIDSAFATVRTSKHPKRIFLTTASQTQACVSINR